MPLDFREAFEDMRPFFKRHRPFAIAECMQGRSLVSERSKVVSSREMMHATSHAPIYSSHKTNNSSTHQTSLENCRPSLFKSYVCPFNELYSSYHDVHRTPPSPHPICHARRPRRWPRHDDLASLAQLASYSGAGWSRRSRVLHALP